MHQAEGTTDMPVPLGRSLAIVEEAESWRRDEADAPPASISSHHTGESFSESNSGGGSSGEDFVESARE